jgi:transcriptional regulator with XRE-family HTH domain
MEAPNLLIREMRRESRLSQRELALAAKTSQPAVARYERGVATPSWETLQRLAAACGRQLRLEAEAVADPGDRELATFLLSLTPRQRLQALRRFARLRALAEGVS